MDIFNINNSVLMIILFFNLDEKAMVAMSVLPAILDTRAKKSDYKLVHVIKVSMIFVKLMQGAFPMVLHLDIGSISKIYLNWLQSPPTAKFISILHNKQQSNHG